MTIIGAQILLRRNAAINIVEAWAGSLTYVLAYHRREPYFLTHKSVRGMERVMNRESDVAYFQRRAREEREKSEKAPDPVAYRLHLNFARAYERAMRLKYRKRADDHDFA